MNGDERVDVVIVGGGPAGSALAIHLASAGRRVALLDASTGASRRVGESFAPAVQPLLRELDVWEAFLGCDPLASWGTRSRWGSNETDVHSHLVNPYQQGWHVDRAAFDALLAQTARQRGADVQRGVRVNGACYRGGCWRVTTGHGAALQARVLVDATGRHATIARTLGAQRLLFDRLVGVGCWWRAPASSGDGSVIVEATDDGWWYTAPVPGGGRLTLLMTDADICRARGLNRPAVWLAAAQATVLTSERVGGAEPDGPVRSHAAFSARHRRTDRRPWLTVGDAALAVDPLTGSGIVRALRTASAAANAIAEALDSDGSDAANALAQYDLDRDHECHRYLHERLGYYAAGPTTTAPFWARRYAVASRNNRMAPREPDDSSTERAPTFTNDRTLSRP